MNTTISTDKFKQLLAAVKSQATARKDKEHEASISSLQKVIETKAPMGVDVTLLGITKESLSLPEGHEAAKDIIAEITQPPEASSKDTVGILHPKTGVAADVSLNKKQQKFVETALDGEDTCLIGAAGTGKTTGTGKFIKALEDKGELPPLGVDTKYLQANVAGILITSFTRKAVNNIRRAVPLAYRPHVLTIHKILEFEPVFYDMFDEATQKTRTTMKFEPKRTAYNPIPSGVRLVIYEESSMIGVELYNQLAAAMPHRPQEIFIGDIRQLPPIFGPAILGFKMSLLPVVELTEVYRQALLSPIIRLAHAVLSGDSRKFDLEGKYTEQEPSKEKKDKAGNPVMIDKIKIPKLDAFNESGEHGTVKFQYFQKKLQSETACETVAKQFIAWHRQGYYNADDDVILCPFNKSFGTIEINKHIQNYLGKARGATVHEVISGFDKHYLAVGDRVLYDKEDAVITEIKRNLSYLGKSPQLPSVHLDRWGCLQKELAPEEVAKLEAEEQDFDSEVMDAFIESFSSGDSENRVNQASHVITIRFTYSDDYVTLTSSGEVNNLLGGNAITIHKMQGSEAERVFIVLHGSHQMMVSNELLYTAITRARSHLHVICEMDTFFKGVRTHKVRGATIAEKIDTFKGKGEFKEMQEEMELLKKQREERKLIQAARIRWKEEDKEKQKFVDDSLLKLSAPTTTTTTTTTTVPVPVTYNSSSEAVDLDYEDEEGYDTEYWYVADAGYPEEEEIVYDDWKDYKEPTTTVAPVREQSLEEKLALLLGKKV